MDFCFSVIIPVSLLGEHKLNHPINEITSTDIVPDDDSDEDTWLNQLADERIKTPEFVSVSLDEL